MHFGIYGPFDIRVTNHLVDSSAAAKKKFRKTVDSVKSELADACGCYVFVVKSPNSRRPWYVGRTTRRTFRVECLGALQVNHYNQALAGKAKVRPQIFLIPKFTPKGRFSKPSKSGHPDIEFLETYLIALSLDRNPDLLNQRDTKFLKTMQLPGILNSRRGKRSGAEKALRSCLGL